MLLAAAAICAADEDDPLLADLRKEARKAMLPKNRIPTHPGKILRDQFLRPMKLTQVRPASHLGVPLLRVIVRGRRGITPETAWLLGQASREPPSTWTS